MNYEVAESNLNSSDNINDKYILELRVESLKSCILIDEPNRYESFPILFFNTYQFV